MCVLCEEGWSSWSQAILVITEHISSSHFFYMNFMTKNLFIMFTLSNFIRMFYSAVFNSTNDPYIPDEISE